jgi:hypothetical protein
MHSLSSPHPIRGLSVARSVALQMSKGGGMLAGCHVVDGLQASSGGAHGFSRGEGGLEGLSLLRLFKGLRELRSVAAGVRGGSALMGSVLLTVW